MLLCEKTCYGVAQRSFRYDYISRYAVGALAYVAGQSMQKQQQHGQRGVSGQ